MKTMKTKLEMENHPGQSFRLLLICFMAKDQRLVNSTKFFRSCRPTFWLFSG